MKQSLKRLLSMVLSMLFLVAALVFFFNLVQPAYANMEMLRSQLIGQTQSLNSEKTIVAQAENLISSYENGSEQQNNVGLAIPEGEDVAGALAQVEGIAQNNDVSMTSINIGNPQLSTPASPSGNAPGSAPQAVKPMGSFTLNLIGSGSYANIKSFLSQIETNIRIFDIQSFSMVPTPLTAYTAPATKSASSTGAASANLLNYNISIKTYYQVP